MGEALPLAAIDTCVILDHLVGSDLRFQQNATWTLRQHGQRFNLVIPAIVLAELPGTGAVGGDQGGAQQRTERVAKAYTWIHSSGYLVADLTERVAHQAGYLAGEHKLKGADASVLASALMWNCAYLFTRDSSLLKLAGTFEGLLIVEPPEPPEPPLELDFFPDG